MPDPALIRLRELTNAMSGAGLKSIASLLTRVFGDRSPEDNERWDEQTRDLPQKNVVEALASGVHTTPGLQAEIPTSDLIGIKELPPLDGGQFADASSNTELRALEATGAVRLDGSRVTIPDPPRLLSGIRSLLADSHTWLAVSHQLRRPSLYHDIIEPVSKTLGPLVPYDGFLRICSRVAIIYGVRVRTIPASEIYKGACAFVTRAGAATALTNSTSAGAIDPLERFGTERILSELDITAGTQVETRIRKKDAWRIHNFRDGLLNPELSARRPYFFDKHVTGQAIKATLEALPDTKASVYMDLAASCLLDAVTCPRVELYEVDGFAPWMWRLTRSAPGYVLISLRHRDTRAIDEGIELTFKDPSRLHGFYQDVFRGALFASAKHEAWPLAAVAFAAGFAEKYTFQGIDQRLLRRDAEQDMLKHSKRVQIGDAEPDAQLLSAREYIKSLTA